MIGLADIDMQVFDSMDTFFQLLENKMFSVRSMLPRLCHAGMRGRDLPARGSAFMEQDQFNGIRELIGNVITVEQLRDRR